MSQFFKDLAHEKKEFLMNALCLVTSTRNISEEQKNMVRCKVCGLFKRIYIINFHKFQRTKNIFKQIKNL